MQNAYCHESKLSLAKSSDPQRGSGFDSPSSETTRLLIMFGSMYLFAR
jgi:hypothetical protein